MSLFKNYYVIAGYDLTGHATEKYESWKWSADGEKYLCYQSKGNIQLFDDPCNGSHFYLGYILAHGDQYDFPATEIEFDALTEEAVSIKLKELCDLGIIDSHGGRFKIIAFEECS